MTSSSTGRAFTIEAPNSGSQWGDATPDNTSTLQPLQLASELLQRQYMRLKAFFSAVALVLVVTAATTADAQVVLVAPRVDISPSQVVVSPPRVVYVRRPRVIIAAP